MKKTFAILAIAGIFAVSCKENKTAETTTESTEVAAPDMTVATATVPADEKGVNPAVASQEDLLKEAQSKPLTNLVLSENHFDFGKIKKGEKVSHVYEVTNTGENPLIISNVKPACGCTAPDFTKEPILPGKKGQVTLAFDSSSFDGVVHKQAEIFANTDKAPILLTFSADIQPK